MGIWMNLKQDLRVECTSKNQFALAGLYDERTPEFAQGQNSRTQVAAPVDLEHSYSKLHPDSEKATAAPPDLK
jgi:hypothetical protein